MYQNSTSHFLMCQNSLTFFKINCIQQPPSTCVTKLPHPGSALPLKMHRGDPGPLNRNERWFVRERKGIWVCSRSGKDCEPFICSAQSSLEPSAAGNRCPGGINQHQEDLVSPELLHRLSSIPFNVHQCLCFPAYLPTHSNRNPSAHTQLILQPAESVLSWSTQVCWDYCIPTRASHTSESSHHRNVPAIPHTDLGDLHTRKGRTRVLL